MRPIRFPRLRHPSERAAAFLAASVCALITAVLCARGIHWALLHPDEHVVERRTRSEIAGQVVHKQVFPAGYYRLATAMNRLDALATDAVHGVSDWTQQEGGENTAPIYRDSELPPTRPRLLLRIREWNVALAAVSSFLVFYLMRTLFGGGIAVPMLGTLAYAAHPFVVEHAHYAETDAAMLATGALTFLLMALALRRGRPKLLLIAGLAAGFTVSMKFSYLLFAAVLPVEAAVLERRRGQGAGRASALALGTLAAMLAGYLAGTPMLLLAPRTYLALSKAEKARVFAENAAVLRRLSDVPFANQWVKGRAMFDEASRLGWGWWLWAIASVPLWFTRRMRSHWAAVPLFGLSYAPFAFLVFPWFRQQEFLPMLPFLAATLALPLALALRTRPNVSGHAFAWGMRPGRALLPVIALIALLGAVFSTARDGIRVSSAFAEMETRVAMGRWLALCAPAARHYGVEYYAETGGALGSRPEVGEPARLRHIGKIESYVPETFSALGLDYFLRTPDRRGRQIIDPRTGRRFPEFQRHHDEILAASVPLRTWRAAPDNRPKFSQVSVELYGRPDDGPRVADVPAVPEAPFYVYSSIFGTRALRAGADNPHVGPVEAVHLTRRPATVAFDPLPAGARYYAVAMNFSNDENVRVRWNRGFSPVGAIVPPRGAVLFTSTRSLTSPWRTMAEARVRSSSDGLNDLCLVAVTADRALAEALLRRHGAPAAAIALGHCAPDGSPAKSEALLAAPDPSVAWDALAPACAEAGAALKGAPVASGVSLCGLPLRIQDDFSRICLGPFEFNARANYPGTLSRIRARNCEAGWLWAEFPIVLEPGRYTLRLLISNDPRYTEVACGGDPSRAPLPDFAAIGANVLSAQATGWARNGSLAIELSLVAHGDDIPFAVGFAADHGIYTATASGATLRWHPADLLDSIAALDPRTDSDDDPDDDLLLPTHSL